MIIEILSMNTNISENIWTEFLDLRSRHNILGIQNLAEGYYNMVNSGEAPSWMFDRERIMNRILWMKNGDRLEDYRGE